jgi:hypothetical protein
VGDARARRRADRRARELAEQRRRALGLEGASRPAVRRATREQIAEAPLWTDDYSDPLPRARAQRIRGPAGRRLDDRADRIAVPPGALLFVATTFASAFLIFLVQPLVAKRILPWFGGVAGGLVAVSRLLPDHAVRRLCVRAPA